LYQLVLCEQFDELDQIFHSFNPMQILGIESAEIRHSNVLAWILSPSENHGLGDSIIRGILAQCLAINDSIPEGYELETTYFADFSDSYVVREWHHIDLLITSARNKKAIIIENKIFASESPNQLKRYLDEAMEIFKDYCILPIFLTLDGREAENDDRYLRISHADVVAIINRELERKKSSLRPEVTEFIKQYTQSISRFLGMDKKTEALCQQIIREHKGAVSMLVKVATAGKTALEKASISLSSSHPELGITYCDSKCIWLKHKDWDKLKGYTINWNSGYPLAIWFSEYYDKLKIVLEVGPFQPSELRVRFIEHLESCGFHIRRQAKRAESQYTRVFTNTAVIKDWQDEDELAEKLNALFSGKATSQLKMLIDASNTFPWPMHK